MTHMELRPLSPAAVELGALLKEGRFAATVSPLAAATVLDVPLDSLLNIEHGKEDSSLEALVYREGWIDELIQLYELDAMSGARLRRAKDRLCEELHAKAWRRSRPR
jgi:hypothetical protein